MINEFSFITDLHVSNRISATTSFFDRYWAGIDEHPIPILMYIHVE